MTFERDKTPIAYCSVQVEFLHFDQCFRPFFSPFATIKCYQANFTDTSSDGKTAKENHKNASIFRLSTEIWIIQICDVLLFL